MIELYCDGACSGNPGPGGWAFLIKADFLEEYHKESGFSGENTTNNRMEIKACIEGLSELYAYQIDGEDIEVITDSQYVVNTMTKGWQKNKNKDLWDELEGIINILQADGSRINWKWVKGHASNPYNKVCDELAVKAYKNKGGIIPSRGANKDWAVSLSFEHIEQFIYDNQYIDMYHYVTRDGNEFYLATVNIRELAALGANLESVKKEAQLFINQRYTRK